MPKLKMIPGRIFLVCFLAFLRTTQYNNASEVEDFKPEDHVRKHQISVSVVTKYDIWLDELYKTRSLREAVH